MSVTVERKQARSRNEWSREQRMIAFFSYISQAKAELTTVALRAVAIDLLRANLNILTKFGIIRDAITSEEKEMQERGEISCRRKEEKEKGVVD
jgi:hypothetical protein